MERHRRIVGSGPQRRTVMMEAVPSSAGLWSYQAKPLSSPARHHPRRAKSPKASAGGAGTTSRTTTTTTTTSSSSRTRARNGGNAKPRAGEVNPESPTRTRTTRAGLTSPTASGDSEFVSRAVGQALAEARIRSTSERQRALALARASHKEREQFLEDRIEELEDHLAESRKQCRQTEADSKVVAEAAEQTAAKADQLAAALVESDQRLGDVTATSEARLAEIRQLAAVVETHSKCPAQVSDLRREVATALSANVALASEKSELQAELDAARAGLEEAADETSTITSELDTLKQEFAVAVGRVGELQGELDTRDQTFGDKLATGAARVDELTKEVEALTTQTASLQEKLDTETEKAVESHMERERAAARATENQIRLEAERDDLQARLTAANYEIDSLQARLNAATRGTDDAMTALRQQVKAVEEDRDAEMVASSSHTEALQKQIKDRDAALDAARADLRAMEAQLASVSDDAEHKAARTAALEAKLAAKTEAIAAAQAEIADAHRRADDAARKVAAAQEDMAQREAALKASVSRAEKDLEWKNRELRDASSIATTSSKQLMSTEEEVIQLRERLAVLEKDVSKKNTALVTKRSQGDVLRRELETKDQSVIDLSAKINDLTKELAARDRTVRYNEKQYTAATLELKAERDDAVEAAKAAQKDAADLRRQVDAVVSDAQSKSDVASGMVSRIRAQSEEVSRLKADVLKARSVVSATTEQLEAMTAQATATATERDSLATQLAGKERSLSTALTLIKDLEDKQAATQLALDATNRAAAMPSPTTSGLLSLSHRGDSRQLYLATGHPQRLVPVRVAVGSDLICNVNKFVCRLLLQHQIALQDTYQHYAEEDDMQIPHFLAMARDFALVPTLCSETEVEHVFEAVNASEAADGNAAALDSEEFAELLVRLAVMYAPGRYVFGNTDEDLATNPDFGAAFQELLRHLHNHRPEALITGLAFPEKTSPSRRAGAGGGSGVGGAGSGDGLALLPHADLREKVSTLTTENAELRQALEAHDVASVDERQALRQLVNVKSMELQVAEARIGALSALLPAADAATPTAGDAK